MNLCELPLPREKTKIFAARLSGKGLAALRKKHPWIFEDSIEKLSAEAKTGDVAVIFSDRKKLGAGLIDTTSPVRIRMLAFSAGAPEIGPVLFQTLVQKTLERRNALFGKETDGYRLANGESDGFPGLVADRYAETLVLKIYTPAWLPVLGMVTDAFAQAIPEFKNLAIRFSRELSSMDETLRRGLSDGMLFGPENWDGTVQFHEHNLLFEANVKTGQKTGFFLDQRENRARGGALARGKKVLNVFSYTGGFSLYAAANGAKEVTDVDFSRPAIEASAKNFKLNSLQNVPHRGIVADAFEAMKNLIDKGEKFGLVIVDPPSFAKSKEEHVQALKSYARLASLAVRLLNPGGTLMFASCSSRVTAEELFEVVHRTAREAGHPLEEFARHAEAPDHPALFPESHYLKCMYAKLM